MKKEISLFLAVLMLISTFYTIPVSAATNGTCGANVSWSLNGSGILTISGTGKMKNYDSYNPYLSPFYSIKDSIKAVVINSGVTSIGDWAFMDCDSMTSISIPSSVTLIGQRAFSGCSALTSVTIPKSVTSIGEAAFSCCYRLTSFTISSSVTSIADLLFYRCENLTTVAIPDSVTSIGEWAFEFCYNLTSVIIPDGVTSISEGTFSRCSRLTSVKIPSSVTSIGDGAFGDCNALTAVTIPRNVTSIGTSAFWGCRSLKSVIIPNGVKSICDYTFRYCSNLLSVTIPKSVTAIGKHAFLDSSKLTDIFYIGSKEIWENIEIDSTNYSDFEAYGTKIHYESNEEMYEYLAKYYPQYLNNRAVSNYLSTCNSAAYRVIESYDETTTGLLAFKEAFENSDKIIIREVLAQMGLSQSLEEEWREKNTLELMKHISQKEYAVEKSWKKVKEDYKDFKFVYSTYSTGKKALLNFAEEIAEHSENLNKTQVENLLNDTFESCDEQLGAAEFFDSSAVSAAIDGADIVLLAVQLYDVEMETIDTLMENIRTDSELYVGLREMKENILSNPSKYVSGKYLSKTGAKLLKAMLSGFSKEIGSTFSICDFLSDISTAKAVVDLTVKLVDQLYTGAEIDEIYGAITAYSFYQTIHSATVSMLTEIMRCKIDGVLPSDELLENYKTFYKFRSQAMGNYLEACAKIAKSDTKKYLLEDLREDMENENGKISFDSYIALCEAALKTDLENGTLACGHENEYAVRHENICTQSYTVYICPICGTSHIGDVAQPKHSYSTTVILPICEAQGYTLSKCTLCGIESKSNYTNALGHTYDSSGICTVCGNISICSPCYCNKLNIKRQVKDNTLTLNISAENDFSAFSNLTMLLAEYNANDELLSVKQGDKTQSDSKTIQLSVELPSQQKYKIMLWDNELRPLINTIEK